MNLLKNYIQNFIKNSGTSILFGSITARLLSFFASWIALQLVPNKELGIVLFSYNIILFIIPICGLGLHQSLLRYGALLKTTKEKNSLFKYTLRKGVLFTIVLIALIAISSLFIKFQFTNTKYYLIFLSFLLIPMYVFELIKVHFRLQHKNKLFAATDVIFSLVLTLSTLIFSYYFKEKGYAMALLLTPSISVFFFINRFKGSLSSKNKPLVINTNFWKYGFFASLSNVVTQLLFVIDILLIGLLSNDIEMVTNYKYVSLIPLSLLFLPRAFINADFVSFTEKINNKKYIIRYIKSYLSLFSLISFVICFFFIFYSKYILNLFDPNFIQFSESFIILTIGVCGILILRGLFGNLISSIGKVQANFYITSIALVLNIISNFYLIPIYGIKGAAITSASIMWLTGIISFIYFYWYYINRFLSKK